VSKTYLDRFTAEHLATNSISLDRQKLVLKTIRSLETYSERPLEDIDEVDVRVWSTALIEHGYKPSSVATLMKAVRSFYRWLWSAHIIDADRYLHIRNVPIPRGAYSGQPRPYSRREIATMWADLATTWPYTTDLTMRRWRNGTSPWRSVKKHAMRLQLNAICELALVCGLRRIEIHRLGFDDVHPDNRYIVVHGKRTDQNPKVREVPYPDSTREAVLAWFRMRGQMSPEPGLGIWLSITGPEPAAALRFRRLGGILTTFGDYELHRLRHTCATERLRAGMTLEQLSRFLGHSDISQTLAYAKLINDDIHRSAERTDAAFQAAIGRPQAAA
jgi:site-specific recombinase XerD